MRPFRLFLMRLLLLIALCHLAVAQECGILTACPQGSCCNIFESCGTGIGYCDAGSCFLQCPPAPPPPECGVVVGGLQCPLGQCCNLKGLCGTGELFCGVDNCQSQCSTPDVSPPSTSPSGDGEPPLPDATVTTENPPPPLKGSTPAGKRGKSPAPPPPPRSSSASGGKKKKNQAWVAGVAVPAFLVSSCAACVWKKKKKNKKKSSAPASAPANPSSTARDTAKLGTWDTVLQSMGCVFSLFSSEDSKEEEDHIKADDGPKVAEAAGDSSQAHTDDLRKVHDADTATAHCDNEAAAQEDCNV